MKFKVLLRKRGGARARAAAGVERGAANTMTSGKALHQVYSRRQDACEHVDVELELLEGGEIRLGGR